MARVLVTEKIAQSGLDLLAKAGHDVSIQEGLSPEELLVAIVGAQALIIRSSTQVTAEVLEAGSSLEVVGRAGVRKGHRGGSQIVNGHQPLLEQRAGRAVPLGILLCVGPAHDIDIDLQGGHDDVGAVFPHLIEPHPVFQGEAGELLIVVL